MRCRFRIRGATAVWFTIVVLAPACTRKTAAQTDAPDAAVPVLVRHVKVEAVQQEVVALGTLWGDEDATSAPKVSGHVTAVHKDVGDRTSSGDVLAEIDPTDYEL